MKVKSWLKYLIYISLILVIVFWGQYIFEDMRKTTQSTFNYNPYMQNIIMIIFYGAIGLLLGLDNLIHEMEKEGTWKINIPKIVLMVIPSLYFSLPIFIYYNNHFIINVLTYPISLLLRNGTGFFAVFQLMLGYSVITSFYKFK